MEANSVSVEPAESQQLSGQQAQAIGPVEDNSSWTIPGKDGQTTTVIAHDGTDGQLIRGSGALSFRLGDFFSGTDKEQMRLTEEGNLGIGIAKPKAKLDVAGTVRAREGFQFADGSNLNVNDKGALSLTNSNGIISTNVLGTGTQNKLAKWAETGGSGTLGDSNVTEVGGSVGIGVALPGDLLDITGPPNGAGRSGIHVTTPSSTGNATLYFENNRGSFSAYGGVLTGGSANSNVFFGVTRADKTFLIADGPFSLGLGIGTLVAQPVIFGTNNAERMRISTAGNVGIGTYRAGVEADGGWKYGGGRRTSR